LHLIQANFNKNQNTKGFAYNQQTLNKFEVSDETFNELKLPYDRIFGELRTVKVVCRVVFD